MYGTDIFSVADPLLCEEVLKSKSYAISKLTQARFQMFVGKNGLNSLEGATWKKHRRLIMPLFHSGFLSYALDVITDKTEALTQKLKDLPDESSVEVFSLIKNLALDIISKAAFGYDLKVQENPEGKIVQVCLFVCLKMFILPRKISQLVLFFSVQVIVKWEAGRFARCPVRPDPELIRPESEALSPGV